MTTHVLFDFDGTLVDSAPAILTCFEQALSAHGLPAFRPIDASLIGPPLRQTLEAVSGCQDPQLIDALAASFRELYDSRVCLQTPAYDGCQHMLHALKARGLRMAIATNKRLAPTRSIIAALGWQDLFVEVMASDSHPGRYAHKAGMIGALLSDLGIEASAAIYVGDTPADGCAAAANGVEFWPVDWGYGRFEPSERPLATPRHLLERLASA
ncbi:HAD hydrolase-like protein [Pseudoxanthomonas sp.]|uniref:HAD family hydrolase n=1 Tax=Pseudoxanthomonas sp. TaxID=1871049 RepID=UPI00258A8786|nr:HAD hydrolase-like protein [Pseudoxanthomonas sp.]MCR6687147.1 HAD hydrolase-like protein [Pseudoxanthomonas sp.]